MKICVYAIAKNEERHVERFCKAAAEADLVLIADTGSADKTIELAKQAGAEVCSITVNPWRYDAARNLALGLIPDDMDLCVAMDLDEYLCEGWRQEIEKAWTPGVVQITYPFKVGDSVFDNNKIHSRHGFIWEWPVHECLSRDLRLPGETIRVDRQLILHDPVQEASADKHFKMLEWAYQQYPESGRMAFYFARDLINLGRYSEAQEPLQRYLAQDPRKNAPERAWCMRMMGRCLTEQKNASEALSWFRKAVQELPGDLDCWLALGHGYYSQEMWAEAYGVFRAAAIKAGKDSFLGDPTVTGASAWDWASLAASRAGLKYEAISCCREALRHSPEDQRLQANLKAFEDEHQAVEERRS